MDSPFLRGAPSLRFTWKRFLLKVEEVETEQSMVSLYVENRIRNTFTGQPLAGFAGYFCVRMDIRLTACLHLEMDHA